MTGVSIGYARCLTAEQGLEANRQIVLTLGVPDERISPGRAYFSTNRKHPGHGQRRPPPYRSRP